MKVKMLKLIQFRNYASLEFRPDEKLSILLGENAQGKTNIVEAIYLCASGRSHRTPRDGELIHWETEGAYVRTDVERDSSVRRIELRLPKNGKKQIKLDGVPVARMGELMGCLNAVLFSPEDLRLVKDGPGERRRFMDSELSQMRPTYFYCLSQYQRALAQRNALLKEIAAGRGKAEMLGVWDEQLASAGAQLTMFRGKFMNSLAKIAKEMHKEVSNGKEELLALYRPDVEGDERQKLQSNLLEVLLKTRFDDIRRGLTCTGPHRDDVALLVNGVDVRAYGSQGQQRTAALSLKLSELALMKKATGESPVLLLDDVMSELDETRQELLLGAIDPYQTIITCTHLNKKLQGKGTVTTVKNGAIAL